MSIRDKNEMVLQQLKNSHDSEQYKPIQHPTSQPEGHDINVVNKLTKIPTIQQGTRVIDKAYHEKVNRYDSTYRHYSETGSKAEGNFTNEQLGDTIDSTKRKMIINIDIPVKKGLRDNLDIKINNNHTPGNTDNKSPLYKITNYTDAGTEKDLSTSEIHRKDRKTIQTNIPKDKLIVYHHNKPSQIRENIHQQTIAGVSYEPISDVPLADERRVDIQRETGSVSSKGVVGYRAIHEKKQQHDTDRSERGRQDVKHKNQKNMSPKLKLASPRQYMPRTPRGNSRNISKNSTKLIGQYKKHVEPKQNHDVTNSTDKDSVHENYISKESVKNKNQQTQDRSSKEQTLIVKHNSNIRQLTPKQTSTVNNTNMKPLTHLKQKESKSETNANSVLNESSSNSEIATTTKLEQQNTSKRLDTKDPSNSRPNSNVPISSQKENDRKNQNSEVDTNESTKPICSNNNAINSKAMPESLEKNERTKTVKEASPVETGADNKHEENKKTNTTIQPTHRNVAPRVKTPKQNGVIQVKNPESFAKQKSVKVELKRKSPRQINEPLSAREATRTPKVKQLKTSKELGKVKSNNREKSNIKILSPNGSGVGHLVNAKIVNPQTIKTNDTNDKSKQRPSLNINIQEAQIATEQAKTSNVSDTYSKSKSKLSAEQEDITKEDTLQEAQLATEQAKTSNISDTYSKSKSKLSAEQEDITKEDTLQEAQIATEQAKTSNVSDTYSKSRSKLSEEQNVTKKDTLEEQCVTAKDNEHAKSRPLTANEDTAEETDAPSRQVSPSKTAYSRHHTKVSLSQEADQPSEDETCGGGGDDDDDDDDRLEHSEQPTPPVPPLPLTPSPDDMKLNKLTDLSNADNLLIQLKLQDNENKENYCKFCAMSFRSKIQLEYHKAKFCIAMSDAEDITSINDAREFFTIGNSSIIHSTPRVWSVEGKVSLLRHLESSRVDNSESKLTKFHWDKCFNGRVPECGVKVGFDKTANCFVYVCRAMVNQEFIPGKVLPSRKCAYISSAGEEVVVTDYEVLTDPFELLSWKHADVAGGIPRGAFKAGHDKHDLVYFIARASAPDGSACCGRYIPQEMKCYFPFDGKEHSAETFDFLCKT